MTDIFSYHASGSDPEEFQGQVVRIPKGLKDKHSLLHAIANQLSFPQYFGFNWDALDECLADLSWLQVPEVLVWHDDVPLISIPAEARQYLSVLRRALSEQGKTHVRVSFADDLRSVVQDLLEESTA